MMAEMVPMESMAKMAQTELTAFKALAIAMVMALFPVSIAEVRRDLLD
jgi:hypothetical protein